MKSISEIQTEFEQADGQGLRQLYADYSADARKGVQNLIAKYKKKEKALQAELQRLEAMRVYERKYETQYTCICGIDEAGRGPLAGPVVAGACVLPADLDILYLNDSKKLSAKKRELLYDEISEKALACSVGIVSPERIDEINILQATYEAMRQAVDGLALTPDCILVDAVTIPDIKQKQLGIIKGDAKSVSIAAASILAKVTRDRIMLQYAEVYPEYGFERNKGYGSAEHIDVLKKKGPCPIHRRSFIGSFV
ncbi:MAG: ribonuclease HII [Clostridiaceae bacterium]|nr:ribonuclease HII [Clostridiaceae bacterium]